MSIETGILEMNYTTTYEQRYDDDEEEDVINGYRKQIHYQKNHTKPCWFWGLQSLNWKTNRDISFKIGFSVSETEGRIQSTVEFEDDKATELCKSVGVSYIIYDEELSMYNDDIEFTEPTTLKVDFGSVFNDIPKVLVSIQSMEASQMTYLHIEVVDVKKKFCKIKTDFDKEFIQSVKVGVFAYDGQYEQNIVTTKLNEILIANDEEHEKDRKKAEDQIEKEKEKILQVQSGTYTTTKTTPQSITLYNYESFPSGISFITGFKGINKQTLPIQTILTPIAVDTFQSQTIVRGNFTSITSSYFICSHILENTDGTYFNLMINQTTGGPMNVAMGVQQREEIKCKDSTNESECCSLCHKHKINTVLPCGHAIYCQCCISTSPQHYCSCCQQTSRKFYTFIEAMDFTF